MTIRRLRLIALLGFLLLVAASVAVTFAALQTQHADALVINLAGRQRMLIQKMTLDILGIQVGANPAYYKDLHDTAHVYFERTLNALMYGGQAPYGQVSDLPPQTTVTLPPTRDLKILAQLETVRTNWEEMHSAIHVVLESDPQSSAFAGAVGEVERLSPVILAQMDEAVRLYEAKASRKVALAQALQIGFLGVAVALLFTVSFLTERWLLLPIAQLGAAAQRIGEGDLDAPLSIAGPGEIKRLAGSFDDMRRNLSASQEELRRWAAELDERVNTRTREIAALSAIAQAANHHIEIGPLLDEALPLLTEITGAEAAWVTLLAEDILRENDSAVEEERAAFTLAGAHNLPPALEADGRAEMRWPGCTCQRKLLNGELTAAVNILECQRLQQARGDTRGLRYHAAVPLRLGGQALGNLNLTTPLGRTFSEEELRLLTAVGDQIGVAIGRARLYARLEAQRIEEQAALLRLSQSLLGETDPKAIMDAAARMAAGALKVEFAAIALVDPQRQDFSGQAAIGWPPDLLQMAQRVPLSADTGLAYALRTRATVVIPDESRETRFGKPAWIKEAGIASSMLAPMTVSGEVIGGLVVNSRARRDWNEDEARLLTLIASETAQALGRAWQHTRAVERLERITALHDIDVAITSSLGLNERLNTLLEKVTERLRVDAAAVALINPNTHELNYTARRGLDGEFFADGLLKVKEGVAGQVAHSGEVAAIPDVSAEPRFLRRSIAARLGIVSYLAVPLQARGAIIGVLELATRERHEFLSEEIDFFVTLAGQASIAIENARLFDETQRRAVQQGALAETAGAILATLAQVEALWPTVTIAVRETLTADRSAVYLYDPASDRVTCPYASGLSSEYVSEINRRFREVPGGRLLSDPRPVVIADAQTDPATAPIHDLITREDFHSYAVFPLTAPEGPLGALVAYRDLVAPFSPNDIGAGQMLAHIVAVAMQNARLFEAERVAREQAETLRAATQALSASLNLQQVFDQILSELRRVVPYDSASVQQLKGERLEIIGGHGFPNQEELLGVSFDVRASDNPNVEVIRTRAPLILEDAPAIYEEFRVGPHAAAGIRSWLGVPLLFGDRLIGMIAIDKQEPGFYTGEHAHLALAFAAQAAIAIENARLFESLVNEQHNTGLLYQLSMELAVSLDPQDVANRALRAATDAIGVSRGNIFTVENNGENMQLLALTGYDRETVSDINQRLNWNTSQGVTGRVVRTCAAAIVPDVSQDADWIPIAGLDDWVKSIVSVPLITGDVVVGVLNLLSEELDFFKPESLPLITAIASPVALSLQNARLYESLRQRLAELEILADTSSALRKAGSYNDIPPILLAKAVEGLKADAGVLLLLENDELRFTALHGKTSVSTGDTCPPDAGMIWQALESGKPLFIPDVSQIEELYKSAICQVLMGDALSCICVPLQTATSTIGVVFLNWKKKSFLSADESRLLESLAEIAANAIHRSTLHLQTVQQAQELTLAYDATIEGWSRALDLRDKETEGHSQRVTNLTLQLAQALGVSKSELEHIRRGALLHDIGKMGVPDNILRKAGALSDEEWTMMRRHPQLAHEMLFPIAYLQPALDIPYCHHEKWDGTGYPRGSKGEEIPLTARIFAVVDVFDALTSDRPYRPAWTNRKATAHIRQQAGIHFDPKVVDIFLKMIRKK